MNRFRSGPMLTATVAAFCGFASLAAGQVSLNRITISGVPAAPGLANDPPHAGVELRAGQNRVWFDSLYGGSVRFWSINGQIPTWTNSIVYPHMGAAMQIVYDTGQDATQGSATGISANPMYVPTDPSSLPNNYYAREHEFRPPSPTDPTAVYEVRGFAPFFWISHSPIDDAIANEPNSNWRTTYLRPPVPYLDGVTLDTSSGGPQDGLFFCGDQWAPTSVPWNQRLVRIDEGRVAFKIKVDLREAGSFGYAGVLFRKSIPTTGTASIGDALIASGYQLFVNRAGDVELWRVSAGVQTRVRRWPGAAAQAATRAVQVEVQTHNALPGWIRVLIDGVALDADASVYTDPSPVLGPHIGMYAFGNGGKVHFFDRRVYDVGMEFRARWTGLPSGEIDADVTVTSAMPGIPAHDFIPAGLGMWSNRDYVGPRLDSMEIRNVCGNLLTSTFLDATACATRCIVSQPNPVSGPSLWMGACILKDWSGAAHTFWHGSTDHSVGIYLTPLSAWVDGAPAVSPFGSVSSTPDTDFSTVMGLSALEFFQPLPGYCSDRRRATSYRVVGRYSLQPSYPGSSPVISHQPDGGFFGTGCTAVLATSATAPTAITFQWRRNGVPLTDGPTSHGSVIGGARTATLTVSAISLPDAGNYDCLVATSCGSVISEDAPLSICGAELNCDGQVDFADYLEFLNLYDSDDPRADFNGDGLVDFSDYLQFLNFYDAGC